MVLDTELSSLRELAQKLWAASRVFKLPIREIPDLDNWESVCVKVEKMGYFYDDAEECIAALRDAVIWISEGNTQPNLEKSTNLIRLSHALGKWISDPRFYPER